MVDSTRGETLEELPLLERLLRCSNSTAHECIAGLLWDRWVIEAILKHERCLVSHGKVYKYKCDAGGVQAL